MTRTRLPFRLLTALCLASATGCVTITTPRFLQPAPEREWRSTLNRAHDLAAAGRPTSADSVLASYAATYPGTSQAVETNYWRSVFQLQSGNEARAIPMLRTYVASRPAAYRHEAEALLAAAIRVDTLSRIAAALNNRVITSDGEVVNAKADAKATVKVVTADNKDQEAEIRKLKDELAKSKDELERIKKRLAEPPKKPPYR